MTSEEEIYEERQEADEEIQLDEEELQRLDEIAEEARIKNKIIRAEIMNANDSSESIDDDESDSEKISGDGGDGDTDGKKRPEDKIEFTIEKDDIPRGPISDMASIFGPGSQMSFNPNGSINVRVNEGNMPNVVSNAIRAENAYRGKTGVKEGDSAPSGGFGGLRGLIIRRCIDRFRSIRQERGLNPTQTSWLKWLIIGEEKNDFRRWINPGLGGFRHENMKGELAGLYDKSRHEDLNPVEDERRYWIMQQIGHRLSKGERSELGYGNIEFGVPNSVTKFVSPYTFITNWDLISVKAKAAAWWQRDNVLLRTQHNIGRFALPKKYKLWWAQMYKQNAIEALYDDIDEEIYNENWLKEKGKLQKQLEDMEEELTGYDAFTVEEEKEIKKVYQSWLKEEEKWERLQTAY